MRAAAPTIVSMIDPRARLLREQEIQALLDSAARLDAAGASTLTPGVTPARREALFRSAEVARREAATLAQALKDADV